MQVMQTKLLTFISALLIASPVWAAASTSFDGTSDEIDYGASTSISDTTDITVGCWVYNNNVTQDHAIIGNWDTADGFYLFADDDGGGETDGYKVLIYEGSGSSFCETTTDTNTSKANQWQWVLFTFDAASATGLNVYIDGVLDANSPIDCSAVDDPGSTVAGFLELGRSNVVGDDRAGLLSSCQAWHRVLNEAERTQARWCPGSVGNMAFFDTMMDGGSTHKDLSGNGYTGTVTGATDSSNGPPVMLGCGGPR